MPKTTTDPLLEAFQSGAIFAYPTEAVYGLGCDPDNEQAVLTLLALKQRPMCKGVILVVESYSQARPYINDKAIPEYRRTQIFNSWPGPTTWLLPKSADAPKWITGESDFIAVRVSAHPTIKMLCQKFNKALVSTSANLAGVEPIKSARAIEDTFGGKVVLVDGELGQQVKPSKIMHSLTGQIIREN